MLKTASLLNRMFYFRDLILLNLGYSDSEMHIERNRPENNVCRIWNRAQVTNINWKFVIELRLAKHGVVGVCEDVRKMVLIRCD